MVLLSSVYRYENIRGYIFSPQESPALPTQFDVLIHGEQLFQKILCDMYACIDNDVLDWHRFKQDVIRSDLYEGEIDVL